MDDRTTLPAPIDTAAFDAVAEWLDASLTARLGLPFRALEVERVDGLWHIPALPISSGLMGLTLFRPLAELEPGLTVFFSELQRHLATQPADWTVLVYEQRRHSGSWVCSAEPVAVVERHAVQRFPARFVRDEGFEPDGQS